MTLFYKIFNSWLEICTYVIFYEILYHRRTVVIKFVSFIKILQHCQRTFINASAGFNYILFYCYRFKDTLCIHIVVVFYSIHRKSSFIEKNAIGGCRTLQSSYLVNQKLIRKRQYVRSCLRMTYEAVTTNNLVFSSLILSRY